jgi:hypothetical protein
MILRGYDFFLVSNVSVLTHLCLLAASGS